MLFQDISILILFITFTIPFIISIFIAKRLFSTEKYKKTLLTGNSFQKIVGFIIRLIGLFSIMIVSLIVLLIIFYFLFLLTLGDQYYNAIVFWKNQVISFFPYVFSVFLSFFVVKYLVFSDIYKKTHIILKLLIILLTTTISFIILVLLVSFFFVERQNYKNYLWLKIPYICNNIPTLYIKDYCYEDTARAKQDISVCDKIQGSASTLGTSKSSCYWLVAVAKQDLSICDKLDTYNNYSCYEGIAMTKKDSSICEKISGETLKDKCYYRVTGIHRDESPGVNRGEELCGAIQDIVKKDMCYDDYAAAWPANSSKASACGKIQNQLRKDSCYSFLGRSLEDLSICNKIQTQKDKDVCYWGVATTTHNASICDKIKVQMTKDACLRSI
jgi:hypothetical protein